MKAPRIILAAAVVFAAATTGAFAADQKDVEHAAAKPKWMVSDPHTTAGVYAIWDELEKAKLEKQGFPQYSN
jgi:Spy/CpxP family protein refolding chaperone